MDLLSVFTKMTLVGVLNYVQVRNVARSRHTYWLLKGALVVTLLYQISRLIMTILAVYFSLLSSTLTNNSHRSLVESPLFNIEELFLLPLAIKTISVSRMLSKAFAEKLKFWLAKTGKQSYMSAKVVIQAHHDRAGVPEFFFSISFLHFLLICSFD